MLWERGPRWPVGYAAFWPCLGFGSVEVLPLAAWLDLGQAIQRNHAVQLSLSRCVCGAEVAFMGLQHPVLANRDMGACWLVELGSRETWLAPL